MTTLTGAAYCSHVSYKDPCCHNASDIRICGDVPQNSQFQDGFVAPPKESNTTTLTGAPYCSHV